MSRVLNSLEKIVADPEELTVVELKKLVLDLCHELGFNIVKETTPDYTSVSLVKEKDFYK